MKFVSWWKKVKADITKQPGFISGKFHKSLKAESRYNFINVALWENKRSIWKAYEKSVGPMKTALQQMGVEMTPALFRCHLRILTQASSRRWMRPPSSPAVAQTIQAFDRLDILVDNAGIAVLKSLFPTTMRMSARGPDPVPQGRY